MTERNTEKRLVEAVKNHGGLCPKFVSPGFDGMPDRIVLLSNGRLGFVEVKRQGLKYRPLQLRRAEQLRRLGFQVFLLDCVDDIQRIIAEIGGDAE